MTVAEISPPTSIKDVYDQFMQPHFDGLGDEGIAVVVSRLDNLGLLPTLEESNETRYIEREKGVDAAKVWFDAIMQRRLNNRLHTDG